MKKLGKFELDKIYCGDCLKLIKEIPDNSIDLIVTDPPYGYSFMGKDWDHAVVSVEIWKEHLRVLKPGAFAFIMSAPRQDVLSQMLIRLDQTGFNTDFSSIYWTYASGFPKAMNIGKMVDKQKCRKQLIKKLGRKPTKKEFEKVWEVFREKTDELTNIPKMPKGDCIGVRLRDVDRLIKYKTKGTSDLEGSYAGFQPKPALEVIIVAMKPLSEKTYIDQALKNRKGITWLDDGRIPYESEEDKKEGQSSRVSKTSGKEFFQYEKPRNGFDRSNRSDLKGRFPANLLVSDDVLNDGKKRHAALNKSNTAKPITKWNPFVKENQTTYRDYYKDSGSFSRYFDLDKWAVSKGVKDTFPFLIVPKASKSEKNRGLENMDIKNYHPTVKPIKLLSYLIMLGSREGDINLDSFIGWGTTAIACKLLNRRFIGFEINKEYVEIANARLSAIKHIQEKLL